MLKITNRSRPSGQPGIAGRYHHIRADGTKDTHGGGDDPHSSADGTEDSHSGTEDHLKRVDGSDDPHGGAEDHCRQGW